MAAELGVSNVGLRAWLLREDAERYREMITAALAARVAEADEMLESASDMISIARAREIARYSRMDLERRRPSLYGAKAATAVNIAGTGDMQVQIVNYGVADTPHGAVLEADSDDDAALGHSQVIDSQ